MDPRDYDSGTSTPFQTFSESYLNGRGNVLSSPGLSNRKKMDNISFNLSEFPALAGAGNDDRNLNGLDLNSSTINGTSLLAQNSNAYNFNTNAPYSFHANAHRTQNASFVIQSEEFPALNQQNDVQGSRQHRSPSPSFGFKEDHRGTGQGFPPTSPTRGLDSPKTKKQGMRSLVGTIREMKRNEKPSLDRDTGSVLKLGSDISQLNVSLDAKEPVADLLSSKTCKEKRARNDPFFETPDCYIESGSSLKAMLKKGAAGVNMKKNHFKKHSYATLFHVFYNFSDDLLQVLAAQELYSRGWKFHIESKLWFTLSSNLQNSSLSLDSSESGQYVFFDKKSWSPKLYGVIPASTEITIFLQPEQISLSLS